jgi:hypothetical protein
MTTVENRDLEEVALVQGFLPPKPAPGRKTSKDPTWVRVANGIWRNVKLKSRKTLFERPTIDGARTFRSLHTDKVALARKELARRTSVRLHAVEPPAKFVNWPGRKTLIPANAAASPESDEPRQSKETTMGVVIRLYQTSDYPDKYKQRRPEKTRTDEIRHCATLLSFWETIPIEKCGPAACDRYHTWRVDRKKCRNGKGNRAVDRELNTLNNACKWAVRSELIQRNPIVDRPKYDRASDVKHCREFMPLSADELHESAALLFDHPHSAVLGFQMIAEAYTGLRTEEIIKWGTQGIGDLTPDGEYVNVWRCKNQHSVNPYCRNHDGLKALFDAHAEWKSLNHPESPYFFPSSRTGSAITKTALARALRPMPFRNWSYILARAAV